ncbi:hypothetical protein GXW78_24055 [Roseomonas terrae]|uniref:Uncharacterized protein n=1 Tax=Neoroseomonas terrae TaxID=424799 RepID=A0ABS5EQ70_9PROT|nr:hypothetical protein [Neoroseomonas terrae]MBR0652752.1 hypothetical protein [Neoroseomonas terrae]
MAVLSSLSFEAGPRSLSSTIGRLDLYGRITERHLRWAWLALVKEGPSLEIIAGPLAVTVSWGNMANTDPAARVWAWRRAEAADASHQSMLEDECADVLPAQLAFEDQRREPTRCPYLSVIEGGRAVTSAIS